MKPHIIQFFKFLKKKEDRQIPLKAKLLNHKDFKLSPEELNVEGDLNLTGSPIESLPDNLTVGGVLWLEDTPIESLPNNLKVEGSLIVSHSSIKSLPNNLKVGGSLWLDSTPLAKNYTEGQIRSMVEENGGYVNRSIHLEYYF